MATVTHSRLLPVGLLIPLGMANGITVSTLYWSQALVTHTVAEFGPSPIISLMPGATLIGYAGGVAALAAFAGDLTAPRAMAGHFLLLIGALCAAAAAPSPIVLTSACLFIGVGCALTQRLLTCATLAVAAEHRAQTIGWVIAAGLCGIVLARACVPAASELLGWRTVFCADAALAGSSAFAATMASMRVYRRSTSMNTLRQPKAASLWRGEATLRRAAIQQAVVFAAFNLGWAIFPRLVGGDGSSTGLPMGSVALLGAGAALMSGRLCGKRHAGEVARTGFAIVLVAALALLLTQRAPACVYLAMALLDVGTQIALVANQSRAQALASTPAMRGRLASIVTTMGFAGGAAGSAAGNLLITLM